MLVDGRLYIQCMNSFNSLPDSHLTGDRWSKRIPKFIFQFPTGFSPGIGKSTIVLQHAKNIFQFPTGFSRKNELLPGYRKMDYPLSIPYRILTYC